MRRSLAATLLLLLGLASAARADIRIDDDDLPRRRRPPPSEPPATDPRPEQRLPTPEPRPEPQLPPVPEPRLEQRGCASREMAPEWLFGLGALALGIGGLRRRGKLAAPATR